jgi:hypothetical protein
VTDNPTFKSLMKQFDFLPVEAAPPDLVDVVDLSLEWFAGAVEHLAALTKPGHTVLAGFLEDDEFNACACTVDGHDVVAVNLGILRESRRVCSMALASDVDIPWLQSDPSIRSAGLPIIWTTAVRFVFLHELGHIWKGHTSLAATEFGLRFIDELRMASSGSEIGETNAQTLEMDADVFASTTIMLQVVTGAENISRNRSWIDPKFDELNGRGASAVASALFAIYLVWRMFDEACVLENIEIRSHPPAPMRQSIILAAALDTLTKRHGFEFSKAGAVLTAAMQSAERCFARTRGRPVDMASIAQTISEEGKEYMNRLISNLQVLQPRLDLVKR